MTGHAIALEAIPGIDLPVAGSRPRVLLSAVQGPRPDAARGHQKEKESRIDYPRERRL
jgi:hypothetical protein